MLVSISSTLLLPAGNVYSAAAGQCKAVELPRRDYLHVAAGRSKRVGSGCLSMDIYRSGRDGHPSEDQKQSCDTLSR